MAWGTYELLRVFRRGSSLKLLGKIFGHLVQTHKARQVVRQRDDHIKVVHLLQHTQQLLSTFQLLHAEFSDGEFVRSLP